MCLARDPLCGPRTIGACLECAHSPSSSSLPAGPAGGVATRNVRLLVPLIARVIAERSRVVPASGAAQIAGCPVAHQAVGAWAVGEVSRLLRDSLGHVRPKFGHAIRAHPPPRSPSNHAFQSLTRLRSSSE